MVLASSNPAIAGTPAIAIPGTGRSAMPWACCAFMQAGAGRQAGLVRFDTNNARNQEDIPVATGGP